MAVFSCSIICHVAGGGECVSERDSIKGKQIRKDIHQFVNSNYQHKGKTVATDRMRPFHFLLKSFFFFLMVRVGIILVFIL